MVVGYVLLFAKFLEGLSALLSEGQRVLSESALIHSLGKLLLGRQLEIDVNS